MTFAEGVSHIDDPAEVGAAFERGEWPLGSAVIGLAFNCVHGQCDIRVSGQLKSLLTDS